MGNILMRRALMTGEADLFPQYVQDGLAFCLDGIKNTPNGHDPNSPYWVDLAKPTEGYLYNASAVIAGKYCIPNGAFYRQVISDGSSANIFSVGDSQTVEFVIDVVDNNNERQWLVGRAANAQGNSTIYFYNGEPRIVFGTRTSNARQVSVQSGIHTYASPSFTADTVYVDGVGVVPVLSAYSASASSRSTIFYYRSGNASPNVSKIYAIRIYSRSLTADELAQNARIDRLRFGSGA